MSIATEIERIQNAKSSIKTAIENKGVVVGDGLIDTYASKIDEISGGGGTDVEINDCSYLFYQGARLDIIDEILKLCKNVTNMGKMFTDCTRLTSLDLSNFDTKEVVDMTNMFSNCTGLTSLDLSNFDTSSVANMEYMFYYCQRLQELDLSSFDTSNVTNMGAMFQVCQALTSLNISNFDTSKVTNMGYMFYSCSSLKDIKELDCSSVISMYWAFRNCTNLENLGGFKNYGKAFVNKQSNNGNYKLELNYSSNLTHDSLMNVINKLYDLNLTYDVANGGTLYTQQLVIGADNLAKLTEEEIAIATNKGWVVS